MKHKALVFFILVIFLLTYVSAFERIPFPGRDPLGSICTLDGVCTLSEIIHYSDGDYDAKVSISAPFIVEFPIGVGTIIVPAQSDGVFSIYGGAVTNYSCGNGERYGWLSFEESGAPGYRRTLYGDATNCPIEPNPEREDPPKDPGCAIANANAPGWCEWVANGVWGRCSVTVDSVNYGAKRDSPYQPKYDFPFPGAVTYDSRFIPGYNPITHLPSSASYGSTSVVLTFYSFTMHSSQIHSTDFNVCFERKECVPFCGQTLPCGKVCLPFDVGVYDDPNCGHDDRCLGFPMGQHRDVAPGDGNGYVNDCDYTDFCGNARSTGLYNSCDFSGNPRLIKCGTETQAQIYDDVDNDCDGKICIPEICSATSINACDNVDNDCDGYKDNVSYGVSTACSKYCYTGADGTDGVGLCHGGTRTCSNGSWDVICAGEVTPVIDSCDGLDNDCNGTKDDSAGLECVKNVLYDQTDYRTGDCTSQCKVCQDNRVTSVTLTNLDNSSTSEAKNLLNKAGDFSVTAVASSPNNCLTKYNYELLYSVDGSSWSKAYAGVGVGQSSFSADGSLSRNSTALSDSFNFTMRYLPVVATGYKYKVRAQVVDAKDSKNVSGSVYANNDWTESNVITVVNTVPTASDISIPDRDEMSQNVFVNLSCDSSSYCVDPDVFPYPGSQSLSYFSRIWDEFSTPTSPAPGCSSSATKGDFNPVTGMRYSVPLTAQRTYCADARAFDGLVYSGCSVQRCSDETPFNPTCADLGFNATVSSACVNNPQGKTTVYLNVSCSLVKQVIDNKWFVGLSGVKVFDSSNFLQKVIEFTPLSNCTSESKTIAIVYDSNISGVYVTDLNYGGTYNAKSLWCSSVKSFEADPVKGCGQESTLSISDATLIVAVIVLAIVIGVLLVKGKKPVTKKKIAKKKRKK